MLADRRAIVPQGMRPKGLAGIPFRVALALQDDGWIWRSYAPWVKSNGFPESVKDRPTVAIEQWMLFAKSDGYYYDADAVKLPLAPDGGKRARRGGW